MPHASRALSLLLTGLALALPARAQIHLVQESPADIGGTLLLALTGATPDAPLFLTGPGAAYNAPGSPGTFGLTEAPIARTLFPVGTSNGSGALAVAIPIPSAAALLGRLRPLRAVDLGALPLGSGDVFSNPLAVWFGPHPLSTSPAPEVLGQYGWSVAIGNFVGTSDLDVAVGALETVAGAPGAGRVYVYAGPGLASVTTLTAPLPTAGGSFGYALAALDWNGDGATDLAVGEPGKDGIFPFSNIGAVHVFLHPVGAGSVATYGDPSPVANETLGAALAAACLDASPSDELVVGAPFKDGGQPPGVFASVKVLAYSGGSATLTEVAEPVVTEGQFGLCVAAGDVDGDGFDEILVGEPGHGEPGASGAGAAHLIDGGMITLSLLDDTPAFADKLGTSVAIGDVDGDGLGDLLVGVLGENHAHLYLAPSFGAPLLLASAHPGDDHVGRAVAIADVNGDGALDALVAAGACVAPGSGFACGAVTAHLGPTLAATAYVADAGLLPRALAAGDVDGDGRDEIAIGAPDADPAFVTNAGACLVSQ